MNETIKSILYRRSVRQYSDKQVPSAELERILQAGSYAPSARNNQLRHFLVLRSPDAIAGLSSKAKAAVQRCLPKMAEMVSEPGWIIGYNAPTFIIVSADPAGTVAPEADCALALGNMFVAAYSLGIGSCWIHMLNALNDDAELYAYLAQLGVPAGYRVYGSGAFGYALGQDVDLPPRKGEQFTIIGD